MKRNDEKNLPKKDKQKRGKYMTSVVCQLPRRHGESRKWQPGNPQIMKATKNLLQEKKRRKTIKKMSRISPSKKKKKLNIFLAAKKSA